MTPHLLRVPVAGGELAVHRWPGDGPVVLAAHGITGNGLAWQRVADHLAGEVTLLAPDLRGRAASRHLPAPYGLAAHADDLVAVLDHLGVDRVVLAGHSMGAFVATTAGVRHPGRIRELVLVDGGHGLPLPPGTDGDAVLAAVLGPAFARLAMTFADRASYLEFWARHPAFAELLDATGPPGPVADHLAHDLIGEPPGLRSSCVPAAVRVDGLAVLTEAGAALRRLTVPAVLLWARRGLLDEDQGLYDERRLAGLPIRAELVAAANHYSILLGDAGAAAVAAAIRAAASEIRRIR
ncbi:alpha/beta fold hydrolase [Longispora sp. K20-0274]|uniref:alpha/beta hydrolase n=1 Tax=Longispora sp. K20-0274 TaxID=3088255 RepID=UPI00399A8A37